MLKRTVTVPGATARHRRSLGLHVRPLDLNLNLMPEQPDNHEPSEADIDIVVEETTGKPVKPANLVPAWL